MTNKGIYLDYNATTPVDSLVTEAMLPYFKDQFFNPSANYKTGLTVKKDTDRARQIIANILGAANTDEIIFEGSATESINHAIRGSIKARPKRKHIITTVVEHPAVLETCKDLEKDGYSITYLPVNRSGEISIQDFVTALKPGETAIVSIMHANNETGVIFPIEKLSRITKETDEDIIFHTDATQSASKLAINLTSDFSNVDLLSMSGHKIYAPKGIGILYAKKGTILKTIITGGHQEFNKRSGTQNVPYIMGLAKAFEISQKHLNDGSYQKIKNMRDRLEKKLKEKTTYFYINGESANRMFNTSNLSFDCIEGESILYQLDDKGILVSSGSACSSSSIEPSHVLSSMKVPVTATHGSVRISLGIYTTEKDIDYVIEVLPKIVTSLRDISPFWDRKNNRPSEQALQALQNSSCSC